MRGWATSLELLSLSLSYVCDDTLDAISECTKLVDISLVMDLHCACEATMPRLRSVLSLPALKHVSLDLQFPVSSSDLLSLLHPLWESFRLRRAAGTARPSGLRELDSQELLTSIVI